MTMNNNALTRTTTTAVRGSKAQASTPAELSAIFNVNGMEVKLTPAIVRNYLVSGNKENVTFEELAMFINLCKFQHLNPWLKEAYCIKYGSQPATVVIGKEAFMKRAENNPQYDGLQSGVIVENNETSEIAYRNGTVALPNEETIIGGWAEVYRKDMSHPFRVEVSFDEYCGRTKDGQPNSQWKAKPGTMIRKVAVVQALREAFPNSMGGMYVAEEQGLDEPMTNTIPTAPVDTQPKQDPIPTQSVAEATVSKPSQNTVESEGEPVSDEQWDSTLRF